VQNFHETIYRDFSDPGESRAAAGPDLGIGVKPERHRAGLEAAANERLAR
jgi:hypothetical protein